VVCVVTSVALIAGGIAATAAGAQTTPDAPALPGLSIPDLADFPVPPAGPGDPTWLDDPIEPDTPARPTAAATSTAPTSTAQPHDADRPNTAAQPNTARPTRNDDDQPSPARAGDENQLAVQRPAVSTFAASQQQVTPDSIGTSPASPVQQQVLDLVNSNRRRGGCDELSLDRRLILAAQGHAADMARRDYFAHESRNGDGAGDRVSESGYHWRRYGENIARGPDSAYEVVDGWMHSPEHRENIMDCQLEQMGIGLAFDTDDTPYWVQDFATPMQ